MTLKIKMLIGMSALVLATLGLTGALAAGKGDCGVACPKVECKKACPMDGPCPLCPSCCTGGKIVL